MQGECRINLCNQTSIRNTTLEQKEQELEDQTNLEQKEEDLEDLQQISGDVTWKWPCNGRLEWTF